MMKQVRYFSIAVVTFSIAAASVWVSSDGEQTVCVARAPEFHRSGPGYELIDAARGNVWATRDWTPSTFETFSLPLSWFFWFKNGPRVGVADGGKFLRSPGCSQEGHYSYWNAFGKTFVLVAKLRSFGEGGDTDGLIRGAQVEKYHVLRYAAGQEVSKLQDPAGQSFIAVSRGFDPVQTAPQLPDGWSLKKRTLDTDLAVDLKSAVTVLRLTDGVSYQGPIPQPE